MKILMVTAEYAPMVKTGGLADAVAGLAGALARNGHDVRVLLPLYDGLNGAGSGMEVVASTSSGQILLERQCDREPALYRLRSPGLDATTVYTGDHRDGLRFAGLGLGAVELPALLRWQPDLIHCHDWHAGLVPALAPERGLGPTVLTIHNIGYQGIFGRELVEQAGLDDLGKDAGVNFLQTGIRRADLITTVSPTYAREILTPEYGMGLDELLRARSADLVGILNGVDYGLWGPDVDPYIRHSYSTANTAPKKKVKQELCDELLPGFNVARPLAGMVTRLASQKGVDLLVAALPNLLASTDAGFALLGSGNRALESELEALSAAHPDRIAFRNGHDEALAHGIFGGSDMILVPSRYEPCGLTQMYALRYGTIPVVRRTGGLADTVTHFDPVSGKGNGSVFEDADPGGLIWALGEAIGWFDDTCAWPCVVANAMSEEFSWNRQAGRYEATYRQLISR